MLPADYKWGYCRNCVKNVPHYEWYSSALFRLVDQMTFRKFRLIGVGPWHCVHCQIGTFYLRPAREDAVDYPIPASDSESDSTTKIETGQTESIGNFIREDESLVLRATRLKRFSQKYRDAVVRRVLKGSSTMAQVRQEMDVTEAELIVWISDVFDRQQVKIDSLENDFKSNPSLRIVHKREDSEPAIDSISNGITLDGQVRPK